MPAATAQLLGEMLSAGHLGFGQVKHLTAHHPGPLGTIEARATAPTAARPVHDHLVRVASLQQRHARRAGLATPACGSPCAPLVPPPGVISRQIIADLRRTAKGERSNELAQLTERAQEADYVALGSVR
jgi:hypothetical protein